MHNCHRPSGESGVIRQATIADLDRLIAIRAWVRENRLSNPGSIRAADYRAYIKAGCCWVWESDEGIGGFAALDAEAASVWALFVAPECERRGIGRALLDRMVAEARERRLVRLSLFTSVGSRAEGVYRSAGWLPVGLNETGEIQMELTL